MKRAFNMKQKAFLIIFNGFPLNHISIRYQDFHDINRKLVPAKMYIFKIIKKLRNAKLININIL